MNNNQKQQFQQNMQTGTGLTRYRSAPSSYFASLLNTSAGDGGFGVDDFEQLFNPRASSPETQRIFSRFMNSDDSIQQNCSSSMILPPQSQFLPPAKAEPPPEVQPPPPQQLQRQQSNDYSSASHQVMYQSHNSGAATSSTAVEGEYNRLLGSFNTAEMKMERGGGGSLIRHSSSPAGLFANINIENEFGTTRAMGNFGVGNSANAETSSSSFSSASRFRSQMDYPSSRQTSSGMMMDTISEIENKGMGESIDNEDHRGDNVDYITGFPMSNAWDDSSLLSDINYLKGLADNDTNRFSNASASNDQSNEGGNQTRTPLSHQLSLPTSSSELSAMEKLLQDSVPCKIRAKRGHATHPRSIAERVRRTKISERMRKLQELVPNMEKQTNTSDMLDLAVDYIKDLQKQVKTLSDNRAKCSCSAGQKS